MKKFPVFEPSLTGHESRWVTEAIEKNFISGTSPIISSFEKQFAGFSEMPHAVAVANGTAAIHVALLALGIGEGDEVIVPNMTIISDPLGVILCGAKPVFVDVNPTDFCLDISKIEQALTPRTKAILAVHMYGHACDMDRLEQICSTKNIFLVEDAAQAMSGKWGTKALGSIGSASTYSFYANKLITTGEGGAVCFKDMDASHRAQTIRNLGFNPDPNLRFIHTYFSNNYRMSGLQAAFGLGQLEGIDLLIEKRRNVQKWYRRELSKVPGIFIGEPHTKSTPAFWMQTVVLDKDCRKSLQTLTLALGAQGIETRRFFYPLHRQPVLTKFHSQSEEQFPISENVFERGFYLPSSPHLTEGDIVFICRTLATEFQ